MSGKAHEQRLEEVVAGPHRAPGTIQVRQEIVALGIVLGICFVAFMLWFIYSRTDAITHPAQAQGLSQPAAPLAPVRPEDLGVPPRSEALPTRQATDAPTVSTTLSPQDLAAAPAAATAAPAEQSVPSSANTTPITPSPEQVRQARVDRVDVERRAAAESDLIVPVSHEAASLSHASTARVALRSTDPDDYDLPPASDYMLRRGMVIPASLITSIDSSIPGIVTAVVNQDVYDSQHRVIVVPRGAKLTGAYASGIVQGQHRLSVAWDAIQLSNDHTIVLDEMPGIDLAGTSGFGAAVDNHTRRMFSNVLLLSVLAAGAQLSQPQNTCNSISYCPPSFGQTVASSAGTQLAQTGSAILQRDANIPPTLHVIEGAQVAIMVTHDIPMHPWVTP